MSDLTKNKAANALVWAAFFAFWFHSLHCCRAHTSSERCVFRLTPSRSINDSTSDVCNAFHCSNRFSACDRSSLRAASRLERSKPSETPSFDRNRRVERPACASACPSTQIAPKKKFFGDFDVLSHRTLAAPFANDFRLVPASAFLTRFAATFSSPLYLRLRKLLN